MKTKIKIAVIAMMGMSFWGYAQEKITTENGAKSDFIYKNGNVGIGDSNPGGKLSLRDGSQVLNFLTNKKLTGTWPASNEAKTMTIQSSGSSSGNIAFATGNSEKMRISANGNVGIGTYAPKHKLDINTGGGNLKTYTYGLEHTVNTTGGWARAFRLRNENDNKTTVFGSHNGNAYISTGFDISEDATGYRNQKFTINRNGNAALYGKFEAKEIKVTTSPTADFVFEEDYNLPTLKSIEKHIKEKKHLPEIASAKEMEKNGINVGNFQIQLLQKIEELTLYTIEQEKEIKELKKEKAENKKQQKEIDELKALVKKLLKDKN